VAIARVEDGGEVIAAVDAGAGNGAQAGAEWMSGVELVLLLEQ
jgi:hypothetical protein